MSFNKYTLMNGIKVIFLSQCMSILYVLWVEFEGVTTWYQSVPGLNTLGTWEVISITMGSSRLIET